MFVARSLSSRCLSFAAVPLRSEVAALRVVSPPRLLSSTVIVAMAQQQQAIQAVVSDPSKFDKLEHLQINTVDIQEPGEKQVLVRIVLRPMNPTDVAQSKGDALQMALPNVLSSKAPVHVTSTGGATHLAHLRITCGQSEPTSVVICRCIWGWPRRQALHSRVRLHTCGRLY